tara:strand:+ start:51 stop:638 length:588 start_codon:yes stop_codon:yes gene_type:complete
MKGIIILIISLLITQGLNLTTNLKPTVNQSNPFEYIPIITSNVYADLLIVLITFSGILFQSNTLTRWYKQYRLSAMLADILIGVLYLVFARYIVSRLSIQVDLFQFTLIAIGIQIVGDLLFYGLFTTIPKGYNHMLDFFKEYANESGLNALWGDSILIVVGVILSAWLNQQSFDVNIVSLLVGVYLIPYFIYMKN